MNPEFTHTLGQRTVFGQNHAGIAKRTQVFGRVKRQTAHIPHGAGHTRADPRADGLGGIFHDEKPVALSYFENLRHLSTATVHMNGHDPFRILRDGLFKPPRREIERVGVDIHEHRLRAQAMDDARGGEKRKRRSDYFISRANVVRHQRQQQSIRARGDGDGVPCAAVGRHFGLKSADLLTHDEPLMGHHFVHRRQNLRFQRPVLGFQVIKGYAHGDFLVLSKNLLDETQVGAGGRTRTGKGLPPVDFESTASTNSATPAERSCNLASPHALWQDASRIFASCDTHPPYSVQFDADTSCASTRQEMESSHSGHKTMKRPSGSSSISSLNTLRQLRQCTRLQAVHALGRACRNRKPHAGHS